MKVILTTLLSLALVLHVYAGSATWNLNPTSTSWNTAANWTPATVPQDPADTATFGVSNKTNVSLSSSVSIDGTVFGAGASGFAITLPSNLQLTMSGIGITNNSGIPQNFIVRGGASLSLSDSATLGDLTMITNQAASDTGPSGSTGFADQATAGNASITNEGATAAGIIGGSTYFGGTSSAANATFIGKGSNVASTIGSFITFTEDATAGDATITLEGGAVTDAAGGWIQFLNGGNAGNSHITALGGELDGAEGGAIIFSTGSSAGSSTLTAMGQFEGREIGPYLEFDYDSAGGRARIRLLDGGALFMMNHNPLELTIGSLEGNGLVFLSNHVLTVGTNNLDTTFSGKLQDDHEGGSLIKVGSGRLVLSGRNSYAGGTTVRGGILSLKSSNYSATGTGPVQVDQGTLSGTGTIIGGVTVGQTSGRPALLSPGHHGEQNTGNLTIQSALSFNNTGSYSCQLDSSRMLTDTVIANGVTISSGATISTSDLGNTELSSGTILAIIINSAGTPISGHFSNLADGSIITVGSNTFQVSYEGNDGNDLTLTVVP